MQGLMMNRPLKISDIITYAAEAYPSVEIVSVRSEGDIHRTNYLDISKRMAQLAHSLISMGINPGDRVATLAWNGYRHLELYYAISGIGAVCHTINPRLSSDQLTYIINHAEDLLLFVDLTFVPILEAVKEKLPPEIKIITGQTLTRIQQPHYATLLALLVNQKVLFIATAQQFYMQ